MQCNHFEPEASMSFSPRRSPRLAVLSAAFLALTACGQGVDEDVSSELGVNEEGLGETGTYLSSVVWGSSSRIVTQSYDEYAPGYYAYAADVCMTYDHHPGIDVSMPNGTPIYAAEGGTVVQVGCAPYFRPKPVYVQSDSGELHIYGHMQSNTVVLNQRVERGTLLGYSGEQTVAGSCSTPDGTGAHLHFERRSGGCAINPVPKLTSSTTPPPSSGFSVTDKIQVFDGPLNVRSQPGTSGSIVSSLDTGTQMCVIGGPQSADGYTWYQINANGTTGWVAGNFCSLVAAGGCGSSSGPTPIPSSGLVVGDVLYTNDVGVRLRASPSASGTILHDGMPNGTLGVMVGGPVSAAGYVWYQWDTRCGRG